MKYCLSICVDIVFGLDLLLCDGSKVKPFFILIEIILSKSLYSIFEFWFHFIWVRINYTIFFILLLLKLYLCCYTILCYYYYILCYCYSIYVLYITSINIIYICSVVTNIMLHKYC